MTFSTAQVTKSARLVLVQSDQLRGLYPRMIISPGVMSKNPEIGNNDMGVDGSVCNAKHAS